MRSVNNALVLNIAGYEKGMVINMTKKIIFKILLAELFLSILTGCGNNMPTDELVNNIFLTPKQLRNNVKQELDEKYWPDILLTEKEFEEKTGITKDMYVDFLAEEQNIDANIDIMIIVNAREDYVGTIEEKLEDYRSLVIEKNQKYPQNLGKAKASRMETIENYICFVQLGADTSVVADKGEEEIIAYCQEDNERAIDILEKTIFQ